MAEIDDLPADGKPKKKKRKSFAPAAAIALILIAAGLSVYFNIFGIRRRWIYPLLRRVPIVSSLVPVDAEPDPLGAMTPDELKSEVLRLRKDLETAEGEIQAAQDQSSAYLERIKILQAFEEQQAAFKQDKEAFDDMIAAGDPIAYAAFYEKMNPESAERLYQRAAEAAGSAGELKKYAQTFASMDESNAAAALEELIPTDIDLVVAVMKSLSSDRAGEIFNQMSAGNVAAVAKLMAP